MQVTSRTRLHSRLQQMLFIVLLTTAVGLIAWLSTRYTLQADWTYNNRNTLSEASQKLLAELSDPITITAYATNDDRIRQAINNLVKRYQRHKTDLHLRFVDPYTVPGEVRERGVQVDGELIIDYQGRTEHVREMAPRLSEQDLTSALQRVARSDNRLIVFLEGHNERSPINFTDHDLNQWTQELQNRGFEIQTLNFGKTSEIPDHTSVLVIASPQSQLLPGEAALITQYIDRGGNLLWLLDSSELMGLDPLAEQFGLTIQPGILVDPNVNMPVFLPITATGYGHHPITDTFAGNLTLFPQSTGLTVEPPAESWETTPLLTTSSEAWLETSDLKETIEYNADEDIEGPLEVAVALIRDKPATLPNGEEITSETNNQNKTPVINGEESNQLETKSENGDPLETQSVPQELPEPQSTNTNNEQYAVETTDISINVEDTTIDEGEPVNLEQRVVIVGDGDFLSNAFLGYGGNLDLALKMINWLALDDNLIQIPAKTALDLKLELTPTTVILLDIFFLLILPLSLISTGISIWLHRRKA